MRQIEEGVDAFFAQLMHLGENGVLGRLCLNLSPWLVVTAAAAWELAALRCAMRKDDRPAGWIDPLVLRLGDET